MPRVAAAAKMGLSSVAAALAAARAHACTLCHSDLAGRVRDGVLDDGLRVAAEVGAPVVVLAAMIGLGIRWAR